MQTLYSSTCHDPFEGVIGLWLRPTTSLYWQKNQIDTNYSHCYLQREFNSNEKVWKVTLKTQIHRNSESYNWLIEQKEENLYAIFKDSKGGAWQMGNSIVPPILRLLCGKDKNTVTIQLQDYFFESPKK